MLNNLKNEAENIRMTPAEKSAMRASIFGAPTAAPAPSPYFFFDFQFISTRILAPLAVVFLIGASTTYAAEGSLPGEILYPVKIYVNEGVAEALSRTPDTKAEVHAKFAERRLTEAQQLAVAGKLDAVVSEEIALNLENHIEAAEAEAEKAEEAESGKGREARAKLAIALETNARVLVRLGLSRDQATQENTEVLASRFIARADSGAAANTRSMKAAPAADASVATMSLSVAQESSTTVAEDPAMQRTAASLEHEAAEELEEARDLFADVKASLSSSTIAEVERQFSTIETSMSLGSASLGAGSYTQAEEDFMDALSLAIRLQKLFEAHQRFDGDFIVPLLGDVLGDEDEHEDEHEEDHGDDDKVDRGGKLKIDTDIRDSVPLKVLQ